MKGREIVLSGMRPTGALHLGNYFGALKNWLTLQDEYSCYYFIADWHAMMSDYENPEAVSRYSMDMLSVWLSVGLDPEKCVMFRQSDIPQHLELFFIFSAITPLPWLERCPTYKEALQNVELKDIRNYAFLGYPALQAADISLYRADKVPVGRDQLPHLELTREIVRRFNSLYNTGVMVEPEALMTKVEKLTGTDSRKMSKSYGNTIEIYEDSKILRKKINSMVTDPERIHPTDKGHPEVCTVFEYQKIFSDTEASEIEKSCRAGSMGCVECKRKLYDRLEEFIAPIRDKYHYYRDNQKKVKEILEYGNSKAARKAEENMELFRSEMKYV